MNNCRIADRYTYRMTWSHDDGEYVGLCAEFPSLSWLAASSEKALAGIRKVAAEVWQTCAPAANRSQGRCQKNATAANSACGYLRNCIARWLRKRRGRASA